MPSSRSTSPTPGGLGSSLRAAWRRSTSSTALGDGLAKSGGGAGQAASAATSASTLALARTKSGIALAAAARSAALIAAAGGVDAPPTSFEAAGSRRPPRPAPLSTPTAAAPTQAPAAAPSPADTAARASSTTSDGAATAPALTRKPSTAPPSRVPSGPLPSPAAAAEVLPPGVLPDGALWFEEGSTLDESYAGDAAAYASSAAGAARIRYAAFRGRSLAADGVSTGWECPHADPARGRPCATPGCRGCADPSLARTRPATPVDRAGVAVAVATPPGLDLPFWKPASAGGKAAMLAAAAAALAVGQWALVSAALAPLAALSASPGALAATMAAVVLLIGSGVPDAMAAAFTAGTTRARRATRAPVAAAMRVVGTIDALGTLPIILARLEVEIAAMKDDIRSIRCKADWLPSKKGAGGSGKKGGSESGGGVSAAIVAAVAAAAASGVPLVPAVPPAPVVATSSIMRRATSDAEVFHGNW